MGTIESEDMKILHINTSQNGGAAWCAIRINKALAKEGIDSRMLFADGENMPDGVRGEIAKRDVNPWKKYRLLDKLAGMYARHTFGLNAVKLQSNLEKCNKWHLYLHQPLTHYKNIAHHPLIEWADIIHLHWVPDFIDYPTFFKEVKKPIVWTLHDKHPAVGVMHYCSGFHPVPEELKEIDGNCKRIKRKSVSQARNLNLVGISETMVNLCKKSEVLHDFPVTLIHNGVNVDVFKPHDKTEARRKLGIILDAKVFLFSSYGIHDPNKGLDRLIEALEMIDIPNKILICIGGFSGQALPDASFPIVLTGLLKNQTKIAKYYSAADCFIQCSYEESFGQTSLEAMACGTPVVSTPCGIAKELIQPFNGIVCDGYTPESIAEGIRRMIEKEYDPVLIRQHIVDEYRYEKIARQYIDLYSSILK